MTYEIIELDVKAISTTEYEILDREETGVTLDLPNLDTMLPSSVIKRVITAYPLPWYWRNAESKIDFSDPGLLRVEAHFYRKDKVRPLFELRKID